MFENVLFWGVVGVTVFHLLQSVWLITRMDKKVRQWRMLSARSISGKLALTTSCYDQHTPSMPSNQPPNGANGTKKAR